MRILFVDRTTKLKTIKDLDTGARGGMVSSLFRLSNILSQMGHEVFVFSDIENGGRTFDGVHWLSPHEIQLLNKEAFDVLICNRGVGSGYPEIKAKKRVLWTHDLPHNGFAPDPRVLSAFHVVFMSWYAAKIWRTFYKTIKNMTIVPNGVEFGIFHPRENRDLGQMIFASAPNRGLKRLPLIFEAVKNRRKEPVKMVAFSNMAVLHPNEIEDFGHEARHGVRDEEKDGFSLDYKNCWDAGIDLREPVRQPILAETLGRSGLMILPSDYPEICSNIILQSLACGVPVITTGGLGSAPEWVKSGRNGFLTRYMPVDYMVYQIEIVRAATGILADEKLHRKMIRAAEKTKIFSWHEIAVKWEKMLKSL